MIISDIVTLIAVTVGSGGVGTLISVLLTSRNAKLENENAARAAMTNEFNAIVTQLNLNIDRLQKEQQQLREEMSRLGAEQQKAEDYIDTLLAGIANKTIPPIPNRHKY